METLYHSRHAVRNAFDKAERVKLSHRARGLTQDTRATVDGVIDSRTMLILRKFRSAGHIDELGGTISTGKEANVYSAVGRVRLPGGGQNQTSARAVKIFKTSILTFKNRRQYVEGEHRFRHGYQSCANPRKMVRQWAEKEFRNLRRMYQAGVRGPVPICLRGHAFVMSMIGKDDTTPAPRLKDYPARDLREWKRLYIECLALARTLYQTCQLVHGDLSEYNILFYHGHPYIIDVSQATDDAHIHAERFLKRDCVNLAAFFFRKCQGLPDPEEDEREDDSADSLSVDGSDNGDAAGAEGSNSGESAGAGSSDSGATESDCDFERPPARHIRFHEESSQYVCGPSLLNKWKWDAALADKNPWNELEKFMEPQCLVKLDSLEVLNAENTYKYITQKKLEVPFQRRIWPVFDKEAREAQWRIFSEGQRILNNRAVAEDADREVVAERRQLEIPLMDLQNSSVAFQECCGQTLEFVEQHRGRNCSDNTQIFVESLRPQSLHELATVDVERELKKIQKGQPSKYADLVAAASVCCSEGESDEDEGDEVEEAKVPDAAGSECSTDTAEKKFDGKIPSGMDPKEWKRKVKAENKERRLHKLKKKDKKQKLKKSARR